MHKSHIPQCTILWQKCAHVCTFLLQNDALWDIYLMHCGIFIWCIVGFVRWVYRVLCPTGTELPCHLEGRRLPNRAEPIRVYLTKSSTHGRRATRGGRVYYFLESRDVNIQNIARCTTRACMRSKQLTIRQLSPIPHVCATIHPIHQYIIWSWDEARQHLLPRLRRPWGTSGLPQTNGRTCGGGLVGPLKKDWFWACTVLSGRGFRMKTTWRDWQSHQPMLSDIGASSTGKLKVFFWGMYCTYHFVIFQKWPHP